MSSTAATRTPAAIARVRAYLDVDGLVISKPILGTGSSINSRRYKYVLSAETLLHTVQPSVWEGQRPILNDDKISEIAKEMYNVEEGGLVSHVDGNLLLAQSVERGIFVIYDGQHRFEALKRVVEHARDATELKRQINVIVVIAYDATEEEIFSLFKTVNKCTPVAAVFTDDSLSKEENAVLNLAKGAVEQFSTNPITKIHLSSCRTKPRLGNFKKEELIETLFNLWKYEYGKSIPFEQVLEEIDSFNHRVSRAGALSERVKSLLGSHPETFGRCLKTGFWICAFGKLTKSLIEESKRPVVSSSA